MKTQLVTCAWLAATVSLAQAQQASLDQPVTHVNPVVRFQNPPPAPLVGGSDNCATPDPIVGVGQFAFDNTTATTGTEGQSTINCIFYNLIAIGNDVWFGWTAPSTGTVEIKTCGLTTVNTKISAYLGAGCPAPGINSLGCNDNMHAFANGLRSKIVFDVTAGQQITLQIGLFTGTPAAIPGTGQFEITYLQPVSGCVAYDDGTTENALNVTPAVALGLHTTGWLHRYGQVGDVTTVTDVMTAWGYTATGSALPPGLTGKVGLWDDPNDDSNPTDAVLISQGSALMVGQHTNAMQSIPLAPAGTVNGVFFVGAWVEHTNGFPAPMDLTSCGILDQQAWFMGDNAGLFDPNNLTAGSYDPLKTGSINAVNLGVGFPWLLQAVCGAGGTGTVYCPGDGSGTACPCANDSAAGAGEGCLSSLAIGGKLRALGAASISNDMVSLQGTQMPNSSCLYFQGTIQQSAGAGAQFGDGKRCAGGVVIRLGTKTNAAGASTYPVAGDPSVSVKGAVTSPGTRTYQAWYRNAAAFCTPSTFNLTNGLEIAWSL